MYTLAHIIHREQAFMFACMSFRVCICLFVDVHGCSCKPVWACVCVCVRAKLAAFLKPSLWKEHLFIQGPTGWVASDGPACFAHTPLRCLPLINMDSTHRCRIILKGMSHKDQWRMDASRHDAGIFIIYLSSLKSNQQQLLLFQACQWHCNGYKLFTSVY